MTEGGSRAWGVAVCVGRGGTVLEHLYGAIMLSSMPGGDPRTGREHPPQAAATCCGRESGADCEGYQHRVAVLLRELGLADIQPDNLSSVR